MSDSNTSTNKGNTRAPAESSHPTGPTSIEGAEASQLADGGRGSVETDPGKELDRTPPHHTGEAVDSDVNQDIGIAGTPQMREADQESVDGRHQGDK